MVGKFTPSCTSLPALHVFVKSGHTGTHQHTFEPSRFSVTVDIPDFVGTLSLPVEQCLYRVAQEALENVSCHAAARHVTVRLEPGDDHVTLTVSDDGQGFDHVAAESELHLGLRGMQERADMMGGTLTVDSAVGRGTTITLTIAFGSQLAVISPQPEISTG